MNIKEYEDKYWSTFDQILVYRHKAAIDMIKNGKILDIGCGDGMLLKILADKKMLVEGLDHSQEAINKARAKGLNVKKFDFVNNLLPYDDNEFDYVVILDVLEHLYSPEVLLNEAKRVTKKYVIISVPNFNSLSARLQTMTGRVPENNTSRKGHIYWFNYRILKKMVESCNLEIIKIKGSYFYQNKKIISSVMEFFGKVFPSVFALSFVIMVKKKNS